jgi:uncharacterized protein YerC
MAGASHDEKTRARVLKLDADGVSYDLIQAETGVSRRTALRWRRARGGQGRPVGRPSIFPDETKAKALEMHRDEKPLLEIAAATGAEERTIRMWARAAGLKPRPLGRKPQIDRDQVVELLGRFKTQTHVADILGCAQASVSRIVRKGRAA